MPTGHLFVYGYIGTNAGEVSVKNIQAQINKSYDDYVLHIVSGGGDVFEGFGIYNLIKNTGKPVITQIEGVCASIATLIAGAGGTIVMNKTGQFMVHNPTISDLKGDAKILRNAAHQLDQIKTLLVNVYQAKTGLPKEKLDELYDNETWLTAQEAQSMGFVDEVVDAIKAVATIKIDNMKPNLFTKFLNWVKPNLKNQIAVTLEDGRAIVIMAEGEDPIGAQVMLETGEPLPAGDYILATGETLTVDENYTVTKVQPAAPADTTTEDDMKKDEEIAALKAQLAALESEKTAAAQSAATTAQAQVAQVTNKFDLTKKELDDLKAKTAATFGDTTPPGKGPAFKNASTATGDPMNTDLTKFYKNRNLIADDND